MQRTNPALAYRQIWLWLALPLLFAGVVGASAEQATLVADAHVDAARPGVNSGTLSNIDVGGGYTGLMQFDLTLLPPGTAAVQVTRAVLRLYVNRVDIPGMISLQALNGSWSEYGVTNSTLPAKTGAVQVFSVTQAGAYVAMDVTTLVQGWISAPATNNGLALSAGTAAAAFDSKENDLTAHAATLDIEIGSQGATGSVGAQGLAGIAGAAGPAGLPGPAGTAGLSGLQGVAGAAGPAGVKGASGFTYQGAYDPTIAYAFSDVVLFGGSSYISLLPLNRGRSPATNATQWGLVAAGGSGGGGGSGATGSTIGYQGAYSSFVNYGLNDIVVFGGSSYISLFAGNHGNAPGGATNSWGLLAQGVAGATGPQGAPGLVYQGAYASSANYGLGDVVLWQGASYASLLSGNHGNTPSASTAAWGVLTAQGLQGAIGAAGAQGVAGPVGGLGSTGSPGERGDQGLQGIGGQAGAQGLTGAKGDVGSGGPMGPIGLPGPAGLAFKGAYVSSNNYAVADGVLYGGAGYVSLVSGNHGNTPDASPSQWALFASSGAPGVAGAMGPVGGAGPAGAPGPVGASGTTGPQGVTGLRGPAVANYLGTYKSSTNYATADAVSFAGATYVSLVDGNHGNTPDASASAWAVLAGQGPPGATGPIGTSGPVGPAGGPGMAGPQGAPVAFLGAWVAGRAYAVGDAVGYAGSSYIALAAQTSRQPDVSPTVWGLLAQAGVAGAAGPSGGTGSAGAMGPQGAVGVTGAVGATGATGLVYVGTYASASNYGLNDSVSYNGSSYISLVANNRGSAPDVNPTQWGVLGRAGAPGVAGPTGTSGTVGPAGAQGPSGVQGPNGATGATGLNYRGAWNAGNGYAARDAVTYNGATYVAEASSSAVPPDSNASVWSVLAAAGGSGPSGPSGVAASVQVGTVTTGAAGSAATINNRGTATAAVLDFVLPQGATGAAGSGSGGGGGTSGIAFATMYHSVSYNAGFFSLNNTNQSLSETPSVLSWVPNGCVATQLVVFSQQAAKITVMLRVGTPGAMVDSGLSCQVSAGTSCTVTGSVTIPAGSFADLNITHSDSNPMGVWSALTCN